MSLSKRLFEQEVEKNLDAIYDAEYMDYLRKLETEKNKENGK